MLKQLKINQVKNFCSFTILSVNKPRILGQDTNVQRTDPTIKRELEDVFNNYFGHTF